MVKRCARPSRTVRANVFSRSSSSASRPTSGARGPFGRAGPSIASTRRQARSADPSPFSSRGTGVLDDEACPCEAVGGGPDQDLSRPRRLLETRRQVHRLTCGEGGLGILDNELSGFDTDSRLQPELDDGLTHGEGGTGGSLGIVLVRLRDAERRQHRVARELLHDPPVQRDAMGDLVEELVHATANHLRIGAGDETRGVHEVDEQDGGELSLHDVSVETTTGAGFIPRTFRPH